MYNATDTTEDQKYSINSGGITRSGVHVRQSAIGSKAYETHQQESAHERYRYRHEPNNNHTITPEDVGTKRIGTNFDSKSAETAETFIKKRPTGMQPYLEHLLIATIFYFSPSVPT